MADILHNLRIDGRIVYVFQGAPPPGGLDSWWTKRVTGEPREGVEYTLRRTLRDYFDYYHNSRPHEALERNSPFPREIEAPEKGKVIAIPQVGGLHHRYRRAA